MLTKEYKSEHAGRGRVERKNLTVRTMQRRFARLTVAFSRKWENLRAACALHFAYYNLVCRDITESCGLGN